MEQEQIEQRVDEITKTPFSERRKLFAELFKDLLKASNISLREIAHQTRISINFLEAFASGRLDMLPGAVFSRGFLRNICKLVDIESTLIIKAFQASVDETMGKEGQCYDTTDGKENLKSNATNHKDFHLKWLVPVVGSVVALFVIFLPSGDEMDLSKKNLPFAVKALKNANVKRQLKKSERQESVAKDDNRTSVVNESAEHGGEIDNDATASSVPGVTSKESSQQTILIRAKEPVRIKKTLDKAATQSLDLDPKTYSFSFENSAELLIYDASAVEIMYNGRTLGPLGKKGRLRKLSFVKKQQSPHSL